MTRAGFYIIHNNRNKLIYTKDIPWDYELGAEDGAMIKPNPIPTEPEKTIGFVWNAVAAEKMALYVRIRTFWGPEIPITQPLPPYQLRDATLILSFDLAEKINIITVEDKELMEKNYRPYQLDLKDINTIIYLTNDFDEDYKDLIENTVIINTSTKQYYYTFKEDENIDFNDPDFPSEPILPDFPDIDNGGEPVPHNLDKEDENQDLPHEPFIVDEEKLNLITSNLDESSKRIYVPLFYALENNIIQENGIMPIPLNLNDYIYWTYELNVDKFIFTNKVTEIIIIPNSEKRVVISIDKEDKINIKYFAELNLEEKFIRWFKKYFYEVLLEDKEFLNKINTQRNYYIIFQDNPVIGIMTLYKGKTILKFNNYSYKELIENEFPNIRDAMIKKDEDFGGFEEDKDFSQNPNDDYYDQSFGGFTPDEGFIVESKDEELEEDDSSNSTN